MLVEFPGKTEVPQISLNIKVVVELSKAIKVMDAIMNKNGLNLSALGVHSSTKIRFFCQ